MQERHDVVIPLGNKSVDGKNNEIRIAVKSLQMYCSSWLGRIFIVGDKPPVELLNDYVIHISACDPYKHDKDANIIHKIRVAIETISDLTDDFLFISDDQCIMSESTWDDMRPRYQKIYMKNDPWFKQQADSKIWWARLKQTLDRFGDGARFFEPHICAPFNKKIFMEMCNTYRYQKEHGITIYSLYFNFAKIEGEPLFQYFHSKRGVLWPENEDIHIMGYANSSFENLEFRKKLQEKFNVKFI